MPTSSRILALELVLAPAEYKKKLPSLYSICEASTVFLENKLFPLACDAALSRQTAPSCRFYSTATTGVFYCVLLISIRA